MDKDYWKERCEAAERVINTPPEEFDDYKIAIKQWKKIKNTNGTSQEESLKS